MSKVQDAASPTLEERAFPAIEQTIRKFATPGNARAGVCIWYDSGAPAMNWLHENFGCDFDTPVPIWLKVARLIEMRRTS
jgi:hypothetical protein